MILRIKVKESPETLMSMIKHESNGDKKDKLKLLKMVKTNEVKEVKEAAEKLFRHKNTISGWLNKYRSGGIVKLLDKDKGGRPENSLKYLSEDDIELIKEKLNNPEGISSYKELNIWLKEEHGINIPYETLWNFVRKKLKAKLKVPRPSNVKKSPEAEIAFKKNFQNV